MSTDCLLKRLSGLLVSTSLHSLSSSWTGHVWEMIEVMRVVKQ